MRYAAWSRAWCWRCSWRGRFYQALGIAFRGRLRCPGLRRRRVALVLVVLAISVAFALRNSHAANVVEALRADAV